MICWIFWETQLLLNRDLQTPDCLPHGRSNVKPNPRKPHTEPERITTETESCHAEQHSVESSSYVKPSPLIFIYDTGPSLPSLFQISEEWFFHQNLLLQGSRIVLHSEERVRPKLFKLFALTSCVYICRCPKIYVKPSPLIFIYDTGPSLPSLFQISEEWIFHQNLLLQGSRLVLHSEERVRPKTEVTWRNANELILVSVSHIIT